MSSTSMGLQLRSTVKKEGIVEITLARVPTPEPKPEEVVVRIDASPINPSDQGLLFGGADLTTVKASGTADNPVVTASILPAALKALAGRLEQSLPVGNEAAGVVVQVGASPASQAVRASSAGARSTSLMTTRAPSWAKRSAHARPMPRPAPVMTATRSCRSPMARHPTTRPRPSRGPQAPRPR